MAGLTIDDPVTLTAAISSQTVIPGDVILLREGTYTVGEGKDVYSLRWNGTPEKPIIVKPYPRERVRINGGIRITDGSYIRLQDLEIAPTPTTRSFETSQDVDYPDPIYLTGKGCEIVNCYLHDGNLGMKCFGTGGAKIYGNVFHNNGFFTGSQRGYDIYSHNEPGGEIAIENNVFARPFTNVAIHCFSPGNKLQDYAIGNNIFLDAGITLGGSGDVQNNVISGNHCFRASIRAGVSDLTTNRNVVIIDNYLHNGGIHSWWFEDVNVQGNFSSFIEGTDPGTVLYKIPQQGAGAVTWNNNTYHNARWNLAVHGPFGYSDRVSENWLLFADWQTHGFDTNSTFTADAPIGTHITITTNEYKNLETSSPLYDSHIGVIAISNHDGAETVSVDLSSLNLESGKAYRLRNGANYGTEYQQFVYDGSPILVNMIGWTVATPTAWDNALSACSFPQFGCFVLELQ